MNICLYPTLLDGFIRYVNGLQDKTSLLNKINRVETPSSESANKGKAFHLLTSLKSEELEQTKTIQEKTGDNTYRMSFWDFKAPVVDEVWNLRKGGKHEQFACKPIKIGEHNILLYGWIDTLKFGTAQDVKTTGWYKELEYLSLMQWRVYLYCTSAHVFKFIITDFNNVYQEDYTLTNEMLEGLKTWILRFIDFVQENMNEITDKKLFEYEKYFEKYYEKFGY